MGAGLDGAVQAEAQMIAGAEAPPELCALILERVAQSKAVQTLGAASNAAALVRLPLYRFDPKTGKKERERPVGWARLWGGLGGQAFHHKGPTHEAEPD